MPCPHCFTAHSSEEYCQTLVPERKGGNVLRPSRLAAAQREEEAGPDADAARVGQVFGSYKLLRQLGRGAMGTVYEAEHQLIGSRVAVKFLHPELCANPKLVSRFFVEARSVNLIGHENIVAIHDLAVAAGNQYYLVMEYLSGRELMELVHAPPAHDVALRILLQILDAVGAAHARGVVHRDLKPENILLVQRGGSDHFVKLLDFGIAKLFDGQADRTTPGFVIGTPEYMSPEQGRGEAVDGRADLYAVGIIAYELFTGLHPFGRLELYPMLAAHQSQTPRPPRALQPSIPEAVSDAILKALAKRPEDRFQKAADLRDAFAKALAALSAPASPPRRAESVRPGAAPAPAVPSRKGLDVTLVSRTGIELGRGQAFEVSRAGMLVAAERVEVPIFGRLQAKLKGPGGDAVELSCEVVRLITVEQAKSWGMQPGFAVQFVEVGDDAKRKLARILGEPDRRTPGEMPPPPGGLPNPDAEARLRAFRGSAARDPYSLLGLPPDAPTGFIRTRIRATREILQSLLSGRLSDEQRTVAQRAIEEVGSWERRLCDPSERARHDANEHNFRGVARSIAGGLTVSQLEALRAEHEKTHKACLTQAFIAFKSGEAFLKAKEPHLAREKFELAVAKDPLNLDYQRAYWSLVQPRPGRPPGEGRAA